MRAPSSFTAGEILQTFRDEDRPLAPSRAQALARDIAAYGGLQPAIAALAEDRSADLLADALALQALLEERADPARRVRRLLREARDLDARAAPAWAEAADCRGRAAFRQKQGALGAAADLLAQAIAAERHASRLEDTALDKRLRAAGMKAGLDLRETLRDLAA